MRKSISTARPGSNTGVDDSNHQPRKCCNQAVRPGRRGGRGRESSTQPARTTTRPSVSRTVTAEPPSSSSAPTAASSRIAPSRRSASAARSYTGAERSIAYRNGVSSSTRAVAGVVTSTRDQLALSIGSRSPPGAPQNAQVRS